MPSSKSTRTKKSTKKVSKKSSKKKTRDYPEFSDKDLNWNQKKVDVFIGLKKAKAFSKTDACSAAEIAEKAGCSAHHVRYYCTHAMNSGHTGQTEVEGKRGQCFYLTAKGKKIDPKKELKKRQDAGIRSKWMD